MSENDAEEHDNPLSVKDTYSGKIFQLASTSEELNFDLLKEHLTNRTIHLDPPDDYLDKEDLEVPRVFTDESGDIKIVTTIEEVRHVETSEFEALTGSIVLDETGSVIFREQQVLILDTETVNFAIFEDADIFYVILIAGRNLVQHVIDVVANEFDEIELSIDPIPELDSRDIEAVADHLADELMDTTFRDYPQPSINKKRITGRGYQNEPEYEEEKRRGAVHAHMMAISKVGDGSEKVVSISDDGLVRSYSNMTLRSYLSMIRDYILPHITSQSTISNFGGN
ncbi:hypothetical protein ZOD2009_19023 [Haladaptatus paucihalophilus DX253]|uniref:Uncharacterized protein n=1 Tax=Haladaptatus paucihalophilus DX253 TaxID=797209 RepID=E7QYB4_HALPU|nr:hypothetical protein [Haladaptatus paucihalophilus]EFW90439.1 hypothetical protein ZOD2009_19023 [Haladaptatus paucihalophilus DX253]SHL68637.1 hypothetical protein SAMN05444342_4413 [Haladaptatus paucihalophilus DX253]